ncbi:hypothetical protein X801_04634 [Opisthorchis viverrini]|uniref:Pellino RING domain-containing protein n=1 Tax=Opisthorchis viverrini TaxID=6198 RepID=A0A1S8WYJ0_OPIVI|nr:hypothetical protein X801_04634 [Opisthorchis viverrini]
MKKSDTECMKSRRAVHGDLVHIDGLNLARFQCPIMYRTLRLSLSVFPSKSNNSLFADDAPTQTETPSEPYVYLNCGHVHGWHTWVGEANK